MDDILDYDGLTELVDMVDGNAEPATLHGALSGHLCAGARYSDEQWLNAAMDIVESREQPVDRDKQDYFQFYSSTLASLGAEDMDFMPILPPESVGMGQQLEALSQWCSAFLAAFGTSGRDLRNLTEEVGEILQDLAAIAQVEPMDDDSESDANDWMTVVEHVRLSAINLYLEFNQAEPSGDSDTPEPSLH